MRPTSKTYVIIAADADGVCASQTPLAGGALTIEGELASGGTVTLSTGQHVSVTCAGADSARTFTITGTDWLGAALTEDIAGSAASVTKGTKNFKTITSVVVDDATADAVTVGILGELETPWIPLDHYVNPFQYTYSVNIGTATFTVEGTLSDIQDASVTPVTFTVEASGSSDVTSNKTTICRAIRCKVTAYTSGNLEFLVMQPGF
jgi:hypothetical protein